MKRKKKKKLLTFYKQPRVILTLKTNNLFFQIMVKLKKKKNWHLLYWSSCGTKRFSLPVYRGSTKNTYISNFAFGKFIGEKLSIFRFVPIVFIKRGFSKFFNSLWKGFRRIYLKKIYIFDNTPITLNGCKFKKRRRI